MPDLARVFFWIYVLPAGALARLWRGGVERRAAASHWQIPLRSRPVVGRLGSGALRAVYRHGPRRALPMVLLLTLLRRVLPLKVPPEDETALSRYQHEQYTIY